MYFSSLAIGMLAPSNIILFINYFMELQSVKNHCKVTETFGVFTVDLFSIPVAVLPTIYKRIHLSYDSDQMRDNPDVAYDLFITFVLNK